MATLLGTFSEWDDSDGVLDRLAQHGIDQEEIVVERRERMERKVEEIEVFTYIDHFEGPGPEARKGALGGVVGGATAGAGTVLLATAGIAIGPEITSFLGTGAGVAAVAAAVAGAAGGGASGGMIGALLGASDHDATKVKTLETQISDLTETAGFVVTLEVDPERSEEISAVLHKAGADEVSVVGRHETHLRIQLD